VVNYIIGAQSNLLDDVESPTSPFLPEIQVPAGCYQLYNLQAATVLDTFSLQGV